MVILKGTIPKILLRKINKKRKKYKETKECFFIETESCILFQTNKNNILKKIWKLFKQKVLIRLRPKFILKSRHSTGHKTLI